MWDLYQFGVLRSPGVTERRIGPLGLRDKMMMIEQMRAVVDDNSIVTRGDVNGRKVPLLPLDRRKVWPIPLTCKKHKESAVQASLRSILSCRRCEGFTVHSIGLVTGSKGTCSLCLHKSFLFCD